MVFAAEVSCLSHATIRSTHIDNSPPEPLRARVGSLDNTTLRSTNRWKKGLQLSELQRYGMKVWNAKGRTCAQLAPPAANTSSLAVNPAFRQNLERQDREAGVACGVLLVSHPVRFEHVILI